jgi:hypothetical protein
MKVCESVEALALKSGGGGNLNKSSLKKLSVTSSVDLASMLKLIYYMGSGAGTDPRVLGCWALKMRLHISCACVIP